jgi:hypothetical protein
MTPDGFWKGYGKSKEEKKDKKSETWERHYHLEELGKLWGFSRTTMKKWFQDEPGVLRHITGHRRGRVNPYICMRIPESVAKRVYQRHQQQEGK